MFYCVQHKWHSETSHCPTCNPKKEIEWIEYCRKYAEEKMYETYGNWDRQDKILISIFYSHYLRNITEHYTLIKK